MPAGTVGFVGFTVGRKRRNPRLLSKSGVPIVEPGDVLLSPEIQPTIIGAKAFHCPVRNGKEWDRLAMVTRQSSKFFANETKRVVITLDSRVLSIDCFSHQASRL